MSEHGLNCACESLPPSVTREESHFGGRGLIGAKNHPVHPVIPGYGLLSDKRHQKTGQKLIRIIIIIGFIGDTNKIIVQTK